MGGLTSIQRSNVQELDINASSAYRYPPKTGCYFGSYFSMGGQRFDTPQPEAYLFGENSDLNYLSSRPAPFPYPALQPNEPTKTLKSLVNIRKDSLKLVKAVREGEDSEETRYSIEFIFDAEARTAITVHFFAREEIQNGHAIYTAREPSLRSETFHYERGSSQTFYQPAFLFDPSVFEDEFNYTPGKDVIPIVIQCIVEEGEEHAGHSHALIATLEQTMETIFVIKPLKQKQMVDGVYYMLQEIFGIENKTNGDAKMVEEDEFADDIGSDCVICMSDARDTLILPCRHLCLCSTCADSLRYQASCCPICRAPFRALLQIRALRKIGSTVPSPSEDCEHPMSQENVPPGYEAIPLGEALNGPSPSRNGAEGGAGERLLGSASSEGRSRRGRRKPRSCSAASLRSRTSEDQSTGFREENETKTNPMANGSIRSLPETKKKSKAQAVVAQGDVVELFQQSDMKPVVDPLTLKETPPSTASGDTSTGRSTASPQCIAIEGPVSSDPRPRSGGKGSVKSDKSANGGQMLPDAIGPNVDRLVVHGLQETAIDDCCGYEVENNIAATVMYDELEEPQAAELSHNSATLNYAMMDVELPGTPQSNLSFVGNRDSQASYSSTGSTRQLLSTPSSIQLEEEIHEQMV